MIPSRVLHELSEFSYGVGSLDECVHQVDQRADCCGVFKSKLGLQILDITEEDIGTYACSVRTPVDEVVITASIYNAADRSLLWLIIVIVLLILLIVLVCCCLVRMMLCL